MSKLYDWNHDGEMSMFDEEMEFYEYRRTLVEGAGRVRKKDLDHLIDADVADVALVDDDFDDDLDDDFGDDDLT